MTSRIAIFGLPLKSKESAIDDAVSVLRSQGVDACAEGDECISKDSVVLVPVCYTLPMSIPAHDGTYVVKNSRIDGSRFRIMIDEFELRGYSGGIYLDASDEMLIRSRYEMRMMGFDDLISWMEFDAEYAKRRCKAFHTPLERVYSEELAGDEMAIAIMSFLGMTIDDGFVDSIMGKHDESTRNMVSELRHRRNRMSHRGSDMRRFLE